MAERAQNGRDLKQRSNLQVHVDFYFPDVTDTVELVTC